MIIKRLSAYLFVVLCYGLLFGLFAQSAFAADAAMFSLTATQTSFGVGDTVQVSLSVDAGPYATTLSTIDLDLKMSEAGILEAKDTTAPFKPGTIYSTVFNQSVKDNMISGVFYINPDSKPASRSGLVATIDFKAIKEGAVTLSYDKVAATEESKENEYATTSASSLVLNVTSSSASSSSASTSSDSTDTIYSLISPTASDTVTSSEVSSVSSGPEMIILVSLLVGGSIFLAYKLLNKSKKRWI